MHPLAIVGVAVYKRFSHEQCCTLQQGVSLSERHKNNKARGNAPGAGPTYNVEP
jgi:hypothetical protein